MQAVLSSAKPLLEMGHHRDVRSRESIDGLPVVTDCEQVPPGVFDQAADESGPGPAGILELVDEDQVIPRHIARLEMVGGPDEHVLEVERRLCQPPAPTPAWICPVQVEEDPGPVAVEVGAESRS